MGVTLTDVLLFGKAQSDDVDNATLVIYRRNIMRWSAVGGYLDIIVKGVAPLSLPDAIANSLSYVKVFGGTEQNGTPTPDAPVDIVCNNGVLKYTPNLLDMSTENIVLGKYINNSGNVVDSSYNFYNSKYIPVVAGETYTWSTSSSINYFSVMEYDSNYVFTKRTLFSTPGTSGSITLRSDTAFVLIGSNMDGMGAITLDKIAAVDWQFEKGSSATAYKPYSPTGIYAYGTVETIEDTIGNTATAEMLLKVGDYQDVQSILDGVVTRNVGVKVLDGSENWRLYSDICLYDTVDAYKPASPMAILSTHFAGSSQTSSQQSVNTIRLTYGNSDFGIFSIKFEATSGDNIVDDLKQFLADQYAAGTPVIVIYPLAEPTTESVTGQTLQVTDGDNTMEITQASLSGLELEAKYKAAVSLTIQEVQDVNLDPNVEVTIN